MSEALTWIGNFFTAIWNTVLEIVSSGLQWVCDLLSILLGGIIEVVIWTLDKLVALLPDVPAWLTAGSMPPLLVQVNYWLPLPTFSACIALYGAFYAGKHVYRLYAAFRGGA